MNSIVNRFASTSAANELRSDDFAAEDGEFSDAMWGSEAGFGSLAKGVPNFTVPAVPDVSIRYDAQNHIHNKQVTDVL
jgi:20S proteasome subunit beta 5